MNDEYEYRSKLTESELHSLWTKIRNRFPSLYAELTNPQYDRPDFDEHSRSLDGGIHLIIHESFADLPLYPDRIDIYSDMKLFLGLYLVPNSLKGPYRG